MATTTYYMSAISLIVQYLTNLGLIAAGGTLNTYKAGTSAPITTYTDSTGLVQNSNPMTLSSAGRPQSTSGAPVAFWIPGGEAVKLIVTDTGGNILVAIDNVPSLNDLTNSTTTLQNLLASASSSNSTGTGPVSGVDLVANAVKSYDVIADVRAANAPTLVSGQTLSIEIQGGLAVGDSLGGSFYWSAASTAADDGRTVIVPNSAGSAGRWLRYYPLGVPLTIARNVDQSITSSTVLTNDTVLQATLAGGGTYLVRLRLQIVGGATTTQGYKVGTALTGGSVSAGGAGAGVAMGNGTPEAIGGQVGSQLTSQAAVSDTNPDALVCDFTLTVAGTSTFAVQFAQASSSANPTTMKAGSLIEVTRIA